MTGSNTRRRTLVAGLWPDGNAIELDLVRCRRAWLEVGDEYKRVVVPFDMEGARALAENRHLALSCRLEPDRRRLGSDVAEEWTDENVGDLSIPPSLMTRVFVRQK